MKSKQANIRFIDSPIFGQKVFGMRVVVRCELTRPQRKPRCALASRADYISDELLGGNGKVFETAQSIGVLRFSTISSTASRIQLMVSSSVSSFEIKSMIRISFSAVESPRRCSAVITFVGLTFVALMESFHCWKLKMRAWRLP